MDAARLEGEGLRPQAGWEAGAPSASEAVGTRYASPMSDGTLRALGLLSAVYQQPRPSVLVIEEPETSIHAGAVGAVVDLIRHRPQAGY